MSGRNSNNSPDNDATGDIMSWVITFILLAAFWPLGVLMLLKKLNILKISVSSDRQAGAQGARHRRRGGAHRENTHYYDTRQDRRNTSGGASAEIAQAAREIKFAAQQAVSELYADFKREFNNAPEDQAKTQSHRSAAWEDRREYEREQRSGGEGCSYTETENTGTKEREARKDEKKSGSAMPEKKSAKVISVVALLMSIALFIFGVNTIIPAARDIWISGLSGFGNWLDFALSAFYIVGAGVLFFSRNIALRRNERYKMIYAFASERGVVPVSEIANAAGFSKRRVTRDLEAMVNEGYFGEYAYIDRRSDSLVISKKAPDDFSAGGAGEENRAESGEASVNQYMAVILELRDIYSSIADVSISGKVYRIEELAAKIFRIVEENPEKQPMIRRFTGYYMPTTIKLLRSYSLLEKQGVKGENITGAKESIERVLDTLITGFEQQLDQLFSPDAIDIAADINVLEHLMQQDGLSGGSAEMKTMEGVSK